MIKKAVLKKLFELSPIEQKQIKEHQFVNDLSPYVWSKDNKNRMINRKLLSHHSIYLSKHNRFASYPLHSHQFVEINYMLQGECNEMVGGNPIHLEEGSVLMMDIGCHHSVGQLNKNDLMINLIFNNKNISFKFLDKTHKKDSFQFHLSVSFQYFFTESQ